MFKRIIWMGTGMAVGAGGAFWAKRKVEATVEQYLPEQVACAAAGARGLADTVRAAASEGRDAMRSHRGRAAGARRGADVRRRPERWSSPSPRRAGRTGRAGRWGPARRAGVVPVAERGAAVVAALVALGLGGLAAIMMVAGHQPWDGPQVASLTATHGLHRGDLLAVVPLLVGLGLARWCWGQRPAPRTASWEPSADR
ncbi:MAG: hypothetical protein R2702_02730 [Acidimicrobiales bacterium]